MEAHPPTEDAASRPAPPPLHGAQFPCASCGAKLEFQPGTVELECPYCGNRNAIEAGDGVVSELDYHVMLASLARAEPSDEVQTVKCDGCYAQIIKPPRHDAFACPFCDRDIVAAAESTRLIKPRSLLPFYVTREQARASFKKWIASRWFAPNELKKRTRTDDKINGIYLPYWTYDSNTVSSYTGQRGDDYWETESYTAFENGKHVRKTRRVRKTRWRHVSGTVRNRFNDILILASRSLPQDYTRKLEPWDLAHLTPYQDEFLTGFTAERYQVDLPQGFDLAKGVMDGGIRSSIRGDIGGDHQRIHSVNTAYHDVTFKHILLPVWVSAYRYNNQAFRFLVNGRTGEVQGQRPYSWVKITLAIVGGFAIVGTIAAIIALASGG